MRKNFELQPQIDEVEDPEVFKSILSSLLAKIDFLEEKLSMITEESRGKENIIKTIGKKEEQLDRMRHSLTEINERMERPYVVSAELQAVKEVLDVLAESGDCNSVILEGEPGTGKTQWAYSEVGQELQ